MSCDSLLQNLMWLTQHLSWTAPTSARAATALAKRQSRPTFLLKVITEWARIGPLMFHFFQKGNNKLLQNSCQILYLWYSGYTIESWNKDMWTPMVNVISYVKATALMAWTDISRCLSLVGWYSCQKRSLPVFTRDNFLFLLKIDCRYFHFIFSQAIRYRRVQREGCKEANFNKRMKVITRYRTKRANVPWYSVQNPTRISPCLLEYNLCACVKLTMTHTKHYTATIRLCCIIFIFPYSMWMWHWESFFFFSCIIASERLAWTETSPGRIVARPRSTVQLQCHATGYPISNVMWTVKKQGKPVEPVLRNETDGVLTLFLVSAATSGNYSCTVHSTLPCCSDVEAQPPLVKTMELVVQDSTTFGADSPTCESHCAVW